MCSCRLDKSFICRIWSLVHWNWESAYSWHRKSYDCCEKCHDSCHSKATLNPAASLLYKRIVIKTTWMNWFMNLSTVVFTPGTLEISFYPSSPLLYLSFVGVRVVPTCVSWCFQAAATLANLMWAPDLNQEHLVGHLDHPGENVSQIFGRWGFPFLSKLQCFQNLKVEISFFTSKWPDFTHFLRDNTAERHDKVCWLKFDGSRRRVRFVVFGISAMIHIFMVFECFWWDFDLDDFLFVYIYLCI